MPSEKLDKVTVDGLEDEATAAAVDGVKDAAEEAEQDEDEGSEAEVVEGHPADVEAGPCCGAGRSLFLRRLLGGTGPRAEE